MSLLQLSPKCWEVCKEFNQDAHKSNSKTLRNDEASSKKYRKAKKNGQRLSRTMKLCVRGCPSSRPLSFRSKFLRSSKHDLDVHSTNTCFNPLAITYVSVKTSVSKLSFFHSVFVPPMPRGHLCVLSRLQGRWRLEAKSVFPNILSKTVDFFAAELQKNSMNLHQAEEAFRQTKQFLQAR